MSKFVDIYGNVLIDIPNEVKTKSLLVADLDWVGFKVASVLEERSVEVTDSSGKKVGTYKNRTEFKKSPEFLEGGEYEIKDCQVLKHGYESTMNYLSRKFLSDASKTAKTETITLAAGGATNFRDRLPSPLKYKGHREGALRPVALAKVKDYLASAFITIRGEDMEADDVISMFQYRSYFDKERKIVVATPDKDACQTQGYLLNPETSKGMASSAEVTLIEGLGKVEIKEMKSKKKLVFEGRKTLYSQILCGDQTDNYIPCTTYKQNNNISKMAPMLSDVKVYEMLKDCKTDKECFEVVHRQYYSWYKDIKGWYTWEGDWYEGDYIDMLQLYWDFAHMLRWPGDKPDVRKAFKAMGVI